MPAENIGMELRRDKEGVPIISFPKPKGQKICTFIVDVQVIEVTEAAVRFQETFQGHVLGRVFSFNKPTREQVKLMTPYLWSYLKLEATVLLPDADVQQ